MQVIFLYSKPISYNFILVLFTNTVNDIVGRIYFILQTIKPALIILEVMFIMLYNSKVEAKRYKIYTQRRPGCVRNKTS